MILGLAGNEGLRHGEERVATPHRLHRAHITVSPISTHSAHLVPWYFWISPCVMTQKKAESSLTTAAHAFGGERFAARHAACSALKARHLRISRSCGVIA